MEYLTNLNRDKIQIGVMVAMTTYVLYRCLFNPTCEKISPEPLFMESSISTHTNDERWVKSDDRIKKLESEVKRLQDENKELSKEHILHNIVDSLANKSVRMTVRSDSVSESLFEDPAEQFNQFLV